jgi:hypothetical protein
MSAAILEKLHDVTLVAIAFDWAQGSCVAEFAGAPMLPRGPFRLLWSSVTDLHIPRTLEWGPSVSVLSAAEATPGFYELHLQSGDVVTLRAAAVKFEAGSNVAMGSGVAQSEL